MGWDLHDLTQRSKSVDRSASVPFFTSTYSLLRIYEVTIDHSILDHAIPLLDTLGHGGQ